MKITFSQKLNVIFLAENKYPVYAIEVLSALARIDYDIVIPKLPLILPKILFVRSIFFNINRICSPSLSDAGEKSTIFDFPGSLANLLHKNAKYGHIHQNPFFDINSS